MKIKRRLKNIAVFSIFILVFLNANSSKASVGGYPYSFSLYSGGYGVPGISGNATKGTYFNYAQVNVLSYSSPGYTTIAYTSGAIRSNNASIISTGYHSVYYPYNPNNYYCHGETFVLKMQTSSSNPYNVSISGNWTP